MRGGGGGRRVEEPVERRPRLDICRLLNQNLEPIAAALPLMVRDAAWDFPSSLSVGMPLSRLTTCRPMRSVPRSRSTSSYARPSSSLVRAPEPTISNQ